jgi:hypothetical protein
MHEWVTMTIMYLVFCGSEQAISCNLVWSEWLIGLRLPTVIPNLMRFDLLVQGCHLSLSFGSVLLWKKKFYRRLGPNIAQWNLGIFHSVVYCMETLIFLLFELQAFYCDRVDGSSLARWNGIESLRPTCEISVRILTASLGKPVNSEQLRHRAVLHGCGGMEVRVDLTYMRTPI